VTDPRNPAEITAGSGGDAVLAGLVRVIDSNTADITAAFTAGARYAPHLARAKNVRMVVLKEVSPSCGTRHTYYGTFNGTLVLHRGVTAAIRPGATEGISTAISADKKGAAPPTELCFCHATSDSLPRPGLGDVLRRTP
jgi:uncharacterized protein YbbK (DUF523 family)